jgi:uncharacterized protein YcbK (DUF882 family)
VGSLRSARPIGVLAALMIAGSFVAQEAAADGDTRTISLHHVHTLENLTITYKKNGKYDEQALSKINWLMRDWRKNEDIKMDPETIDLLWEVHQEVRATDPIHIIGGYRSPDTNAMLHSRSNGVARFSQHMLGKAIDFFIPGVPLEKLRTVALRIQGGGVGYYPTSGSPFVHLDVGNVRHWPRMTREQLVKVFPDGRTVHVPSDGNPLPGYELALADIERGANHRSASPPKKRSMFAALFGTAQDPEESSDKAMAGQKSATVRGAAPPPAAPQPAAPARTVVAAVAATAVENAPLPPRRPIYQIAAVDNRAVPAAPFTPHIEPIALSANEVVGQRGYWEGVPEAPPRPASFAQAAMDSISNARRFLAVSLAAAAGREPTGAVGSISAADRVPPDVGLSYAAEIGIDNSSKVLEVRPGPMGRLVESPPVTVIAKSTASIARRPFETAASTYPVPTPSRVNERLNDPWLRGLMLASSVQSSLVVTRIGEPDLTNLTSYMRKPNAAVVMTFSHDPHPGIGTEAFSGSAVVFQSTMTFGVRRTAGLQ